jgi:hypothetical protein
LQSEENMAARRAWVAVSVLVFAAEASATPIIQVNGPVDFSAVAASPNQFGTYTYLVASWNQAVGFSGASISFPGSSGGTTVATGTAYLTTSVGLGTTVADEIAHTRFSVLQGPSSRITLFSGLTLPASSYYVTIFADPGNQISWDATNSPVTTLGPGVSLNFPVAVGENNVSNGFDPYPPATQYVFGIQNNLLIDVNAPEPGSLSLLVLGGVAALILRGHRFRQL